MLYDVRASWTVPDMIKSNGGTPLIERVGQAFIKARMSAEDAIFAGEVSGHWMLREGIRSWDFLSKFLGHYRFSKVECIFEAKRRIINLLGVNANLEQENSEKYIFLMSELGREALTVASKRSG